MAHFKISNILPDCLVPKDIPKGLILTLIITIMLMSLSAYRYGNGNALQGILHVLENWVLYLFIIPSCTTLVSMPIKYRDDSFDVRMAYYLGMFVGLLFMMAKLRYWR
ncbi:MAG: hypothetical protein Q3971_06740 [Moraxella sp.]|nr:hypothetical protein [Moraxella sp.]